MTEEMIEKIRAHYEHAKQKHPYFCDRLFVREDESNFAADIKAELSHDRSMIRMLTATKRIPAEWLLKCEFMEIMEAFADQKVVDAAKECYDAIAVLLRIIDVLEGRQALGDPEKDGARVWCVRRPLHKCVDYEMCPPVEIEEIILAHRETVKNNQQIDNTSYYILPCGKYLEDYIAWKGLNFAEGSALKYAWRAGEKDGESYAKDNKKKIHYVRFIAERNGINIVEVLKLVDAWVEEAKTWDGKETPDGSVG